MYLLATLMDALTKFQLQHLQLSDAYEEVEEQRQVVGQWKRKVQKMTNEMNDLRMLLEEQNARNNLLEKKQRKFDAECQSLQDASRQERQAKERYGREKMCCKPRNSLWNKRWR